MSEILSFLLLCDCTKRTIVGVRNIVNTDVRWQGQIGPAARVKVSRTEIRVALITTSENTIEIYVQV